MATSDDFAIALNAGIRMDRGSLAAANRTVQQAFAKSSNDIGKQLGAGLQDDLARMNRRGLFGGAGGKPKALEDVRKATGAGAVEAGKFGGWIRDIKQNVSASWHMGGLGRTVETLREAKRHAGDLGASIEKLAKGFGPAGALVGAGSLVGLGGLAVNFGTRSNELLRTSRTLGVSTDILQGFRGAAELAGLGGDAATATFDSLTQNLRGAKYGMQGSDQFRSAVHQLNALVPAGGALDVTAAPDKFLYTLADKIKGQAPGLQRAIAQSFGVEPLLDILRRGGDAVRQLVRQAKINIGQSNEQIAAGDALSKSYYGAMQATDGFANELGDHLMPTFKPLLDGWQDWMNEMKTSPMAMDLVADAGIALGAVVGVTLVSAFARLTISMNKVWALPLMRFLWGGGLGTGIAGGSMALGAAGLFAPDSMLPPGAAEQRGSLFDGVRRWINRAVTGAAPGQEHLPGSPGVTPGGSVIPPSPGVGSYGIGLPGAGQGSRGDPRGVETALRASAAAAGLNPDDVVRVARAEGLGAAKYASWDVNGMSYGAMQMHQGGLADVFQRATGLNPADPKNEIAMNDWAVKYGAQHGWTPWTSVTSGRVPAPRRGPVPAMPADHYFRDGALAGPATGIGPHGEYLIPQNEDQVRDPNWHVGVPAGDQQYGRGDYVPATAQDSKHLVELHFLDAPSGLRSNLRVSSGPAELMTRTQYAFKGP